VYSQQSVPPTQERTGAHAAVRGRPYVSPQPAIHPRTWDGSYSAASRTAGPAFRHWRQDKGPGGQALFHNVAAQLCTPLHPANDGMIIAAARLVQADTVTDALLAGGAAAKQPRVGDARFL
jgi:hypothetical protein